MPKSAFNLCLALTGISLLLAGCAKVGPDYVRPDLDAPTSWGQAGPAGMRLDPQALASWWNTMSDPLLDSYIRKAVADNFDLRQAWSRLRETRARRDISNAALFPTLDANGSTTKSRSSGSELDHFSLGFDAGWELDLFGGERRALEASQAQLESGREDLRDVLVSLPSEADAASAQASVSQAEATLRLNQTDLAKTVIRSPINGIVLSRSVEPGQTVAASLQAPVLFTLAEDLTQMELHVDVDEADVGQVKVDQTAVFTVDAYPDRSFPARIIQVRYGSTTTEGVVTYETILKVDNYDLSLRPGMTATATITFRQAKDVLVVPNAALRFTPAKKTAAERAGRSSILSKLFPRSYRRHPEKQREETLDFRKRQHVYVLTDGRPVAVPVTIGMTDGTVSQVLEGDVQPGQHLVVDVENVAQ